MGVPYDYQCADFAIPWTGKALKILCHPCQFLGQELIGGFLLIAKVSRMCRLQTITNIRCVIALMRISLRDAGAGTEVVVQKPLSHQTVCLKSWQGQDNGFSVLPVQEIMSLKETLENN